MPRYPEKDTSRLAGPCRPRRPGAAGRAHAAGPDILCRMSRAGKLKYLYGYWW